MCDVVDRVMIERIAWCYENLAGVPLSGIEKADDWVRWLDESAPYSLLAHSNAADPHFIYANHFAQKCFGYTREEFLLLPSRKSAASPDRQARQEMLTRLNTEGIVKGYSGERITRSGARFTIFDGVIWQLTDEKGVNWGQGALFWLTSPGNSYTGLHSV